MASGVHAGLPKGLRARVWVVWPRARGEDLAQESWVVVLGDPEEHAVEAPGRVVTHVRGWWKFSGEPMCEEVECGVDEAEVEKVARVSEIVGDKVEDIQRELCEAHGSSDSRVFGEFAV